LLWNLNTTRSRRLPGEDKSSEEAQILTGEERFPNVVGLFKFFKPAPISEIYCSDMDSAFEIWDEPTGTRMSDDSGAMRANALFASMSDESLARSRFEPSASLASKIVNHGFLLLETSASQVSRNLTDSRNSAP
jgi:hypothetical protein